MRSGYGSVACVVPTGKPLPEPLMTYLYIYILKKLIFNGALLT